MEYVYPTTGRIILLNYNQNSQKYEYPYQIENSMVDASDVLPVHCAPSSRVNDLTKEGRTSEDLCFPNDRFYGGP